VKTSARGIMLTGALVIGANGLMASQASNSWLEQWHKAKYGRNTPMEEARQRAERENAALQEETTSEVGPANDWFEQWYKAKVGRSSPMVEARLRAERANTPSREATKVAQPANDWFQQWHRAKFGR
jgi:hypothetical protein